MQEARVGVVGAGFIGRQHLKAWAQLGVETGFFAHHPAKPDPTEIGLTRTQFRSLEELFAVSEIVDVCTPTDTHRQIVMRAAKAGRHVICEKPLGLTIAEVQEMQAACAAGAVRLLPAHVVRFFPEYEAARAAVTSGRIGAPSILRLSRHAPRPDWAGWFAADERSGGILMDLMIHEYDFALSIAGSVTRVYARSPPVQDASACKMGVAVLTHGSGAISHVVGTWGPAGCPVSSQFELSGDQGILFSPEHPRSTTSAFQNPVWSAERSFPVILKRELREFYEVLTRGTTSRLCEADGLAAVAVAAAAVQSAVTGKAISL